jgi:gas vesicle protein
MAKDDICGSGSVLVAFLLGALSGAAVALLFAPASGEQTREFLGDKAREGKAKATDAAQKTRDTIAAAIERGREAYREAREKENA